MIKYIEKGIGLHDAIYAAGHQLIERDGVWVSDDDEAVQAIIDAYDPRPEIRLLVDAERKRREALGCVVQFPDGLGTVQTRDPDDYRNINGMVTAALVLSAQGVTDPVLPFRDAEDSTHMLTPTEMIAVGMAVQQRVGALYGASWAIKQFIEESQNPLEINIGLGWPD